MSQQITSAASTNYLGTLNLEREPFLEQNDDRFFYADPALMQRLDLLQHLTQFGDMMLGVIGPAGIGKTALLRQFALRIHDNWRVCQVDGARIGGADELLAKLADCLGVDTSGDRERLRGALLRQCQGLHHKTQLAVILIDNAEQLPVPALKTLLDLTGDPKETLKLVRVLLFGEADLEQKLIGAGLHTPQRPLLHVLEIPRFDEQQTAAYLMYRLAVAGYSGDSPFSMTEIRAMHKAAEGLPARLNVLAHETLMERAGRIAVRQKIGASLAVAKPAATWRRWAVPALGVAGLAVIGGLVFQSGLIERPSTGEELPLAVPPLASTAPAEEPLASTPKPAPEPILEHTPENEKIAEIKGSLLPPSVTEEQQGPAPVEPAAPPPAAPDSSDVEAGAPPAAASAASEAATPAPQAETGTAADSAVRATATPAPAPTEQLTAAAPAVTTTATPLPLPTEQPVAAEPTVATTASSPPEPTKYSVVAEPAVAATASPPPEPTQLPAVSAPALPEPPPAVSSPPASARDVEGEEWLRTRSKDHFALQLLGVRSLDSLNKYLADNKIPTPVAYFRTEFKGGDWFVLLQGDYPSKDAARAGVKTLPAALQRNKPWPRSFASVHADLEKRTP